MTRRTLIKNGYLLTMDPILGDLERADILIEGETIARIGTDLDTEADEVIDAVGKVITPGLIDTHRHMWQGVLRNAAPDSDLYGYLTSILSEFAPLYRPQDVYAGNFIGAVSALNAGVTTILDWSHISVTPEHSDAAIDALSASGIRGVYAHGSNPVEPNWFGLDTTVPHPEDIRRIRDRIPTEDGRITMAMALRGPEFGSYEMTWPDMRLARELGLRMTVHVGAGALGARNSVEAMHEQNLLGADTTYIHCTTSSDKALQLIADSGGSVSVASTVEMQMGHGVPPFQRLAAAGIRPSLSVDVETTAPGDMFAQMRASLYVSRMQAFERIAAGDDSVRVPQCRDALSWTTIEAARALGLGDRTGSLTPGKQADLVIYDLDQLNVIPVNDALGAIVLAAEAANVCTVLVAGNVVKRDGHLVGVDLAAVSEATHASRDYLFAQAGRVPNDPNRR